MSLVELVELVELAGSVDGASVVEVDVSGSEVGASVVLVEVSGSEVGASVVEVSGTDVEDVWVVEVEVCGADVVWIAAAVASAAPAGATSINGAVTATIETKPASPPPATSAARLPDGPPC